MSEKAGKESQYSLVAPFVRHGGGMGGLTPQASKEVDRGNCLKCLPFTKKGSRLVPQASKKGRGGGGGV